MDINDVNMETIKLGIGSSKRFEFMYFFFSKVLFVGLCSLRCEQRTFLNAKLMGFLFGQVCMAALSG